MQTEKWLNIYYDFRILINMSVPVVPDKCEVLHWKDRKWMGSELNISSLFHPGSDQDQIQVLEKGIWFD